MLHTQPLSKRALFPLVMAVLVSTGPAARAQLSENVTLLSNIDQYAQYNDVWGYTAPGGDEFAILGTTTGTAFYDVTVPGSPQNVGFITGPNSPWRDMKTYSHYCYIVTEGTSGDTGMQIVDLSDPWNPALVNTLSGDFTRAHNLFIDVEAGRVYVVGAAGTSGTFIYDLTGDPENPDSLGVFTDLYIHDIYVKDGVAYAAHINSSSVAIYDVSDPTSWQEINAWTYPGAVTHNTWTNADQTILVTTDEVSGGHLNVWDIQDPENHVFLDDYVAPLAPNASIHNAYIRGAYCYMSYYTEGLQIASIADPDSVVQAGFYDTSIEISPFEGAWGCYPFAARPGIVYISDQQNGLYVLDFAEARVGIEDPGDAPSLTLALKPNYPNPFNPRTTIPFELPDGGRVTLRIFDPTGRGVRTLVDRHVERGAHEANWDGLDQDGHPVASGVYFYRLERDGETRAHRMVLAR